MLATGVRAPREYERALIAEPRWAPSESKDVREAILSAIGCRRAPWFLKLEQVREHVYDFCARSPRLER
eukprot:3692031-Lingulodinium_polyedra.AAC.1